MSTRGNTKEDRGRDKSVIVVLLGMLGWPLFWGAVLCVGFYALIHQGIISSGLVRRYFASHPVEYIEGAMFFVGLAALVLKLWDVLVQHTGLNRTLLDPAPPGGQKVDDCPKLLEQLNAQPSALQSSYLVNRLRGAIQHIQRSGTTGDLGDELKYLSDVDASRQQEGYGLATINIWAIPMLGFLGTVIGITLALGGLSPEALVNTPKEAMEGLLAGLGVAFDTTALALSLAIVLMFVKFLIEQVENQLLAAVDSRAEQELMGRFQVLGGSNDPHLQSVRRMSEQVIRSSEELLRRQTELWQETIDAAHQQWNTLITSAGNQVQNSLVSALDKSIESHAVQLSRSEDAAAQRSRELWDHLQATLSANSKVMDMQQRELHRHGELMLKVVEATGDVVKLEKSLNDNLQALAGSKNFEDTVMSLSAAIHLLSTRLAPGAAGKPVELAAAKKERAA